MKQIVFYSWQADLPNATNRGFIQEALEAAASAIASDASVAIEPVVDRDTQGVPGSPDIAATIFAKITAADVFVADVSIIGRTEVRAISNPNVLIELGYALRVLGHEKVVLVFNKAFGEIEELPFDLRARRVLAYDMPIEGKVRGPERRLLEKQLDSSIRGALQDVRHQRQSEDIPAAVAIESQAPNRIIILRRNLASILGELDRLTPKIHSAGGTANELIEALTQTQEPVAAFSKITEIIAAMDDLGAALEIHRWFGVVFERYQHPEGFTGLSSNADHDYFKFLGHEMFVTFIAFLLAEQRWSILQRILVEPIQIRYLSRFQGPGNVEWMYGSQYLASIIDEGSRRQRVSLHADILNERHTTGGLAAIMPIEQFLAADYFLFLAGELRHSDRDSVFVDWRAWSALYLRHVPPFLRNAERKVIADHLITVLGISSIDEFKQKLVERANKLSGLFRSTWWHSPVDTETINRIGTK